MQIKRISRGGFALPTVLIASVVMLTILAVSVSSVTAVRTTLKTQYYEQLAKAAGEAGVAYAKACLAQNGNKPLWTDNKPLTPSTDCAGNSAFATEPFRALVVAGGGSGGGATGGGGGAGGVITQDDFSLATGAYSVVVGAGGAAPGNKAIGRDGANSSFNNWTAIGGGGGGYSADSTSGAAGRPGGSGGGGQRYYGTYGPGVGTIGQGNDGGSLTGAGAGSTTGGGGAGGPGLNTAVANNGGSGGPGIMSTITGAAVYYGGGGGGGSTGGTCGGSSTGGIGGGGRSGELGTAGQPNTGGGGGGGWCYASGNGGAGGSGVVIVAYPDNGSVTATGGTGSPYSSGGYKIHVFKSSGTLTVSSVTNSSCPTDPRCSVMTEANLRSSFRVTKPTLDANGRALTVPNSGYVELLRSSTGEVWRTYRQPAVQSAVVPDLCSGAAASTLGWQNAVVTSSQQTLANASSAQSISILDTNLAAGQVYFRKDFTVVEAGSYSLSAITDSTSTVVTAYIDGQPVTTAQGSSASASVSLSAGCHTATVQMTNRTLQPKAARFTAALQRSGSAPILATDSSWRASSGSSVHFSQPDFYADPDLWTPVTDYQNPTAQQASAAWQTTQNDIFTRMISPTVSGCPTACPAPASFYLRDSKDFYVSTPTEVQVSTLCDDDCSVFMDGEMVIQNSPWSAINQQTMTITPGPHHIAVRTFNAAATPNPSGTAVSVVVKDTGVVLTRTDRSWLGAIVSTAGTNATTEDIRSYEDSFRPSPDEIPRPTTLDVLLVAGGGGGGGNCNTCGGAGGGGGGGVNYTEGLTATVGTRTVTVGAAGAAGVGGASRTNGGNGGSSVFGALSVSGGGGGGAQLGTAALNGGSGGGGSGGGTPGPGAGGTGVSGQGFAGGAGIADPYSGGGGGGAGGSGVPGAGQNGGNGGAGFMTYMTSGLLVFGAGGGAGVYDANFAGASDVGAGNGSSQSTNAGAGYAGTANTGGGGGGANGRNTGANGGVGGSGVVIVRVKTGSMTISTTGSPAVNNVTIGGIPYTIYRFNASGSFTISAIN